MENNINQPDTETPTLPLTLSDPQSADIAAGKRELLRKLFPEVWNEDKIDFEQLQRVLGEDIEPYGKERFGLSWPGKADCMKVIQQRSVGTLKPMRDASVNFDTSENVVIEGDNLEVLKILQNSYTNKVKMIYIDPPYNTGKEFVYPDRFAENLDTYLQYTDQKNEAGRLWANNTDTGGRYHSNWLNMMYPRLFLARNLLTDDGVIFISIDDHEVHNLRSLCDQVFGEDNFVGQLIWERAYAPKNDAKYISNSHDYVLFYSKSINEFKIGRLPRTEEANARYQNPDNDHRGVWKPSDLSVKTYSADSDYPITTPSGRIVEPPAGRCWRLSKKAFFERLQDNRIWFGPDGNGVPSIKRFLTELRNEGMTPTSLLFYKDVGHSQEGAKEFVSLLDGDADFDGPKPIRLLRRLLQISNTQADDIILDFFAGSGTTGHAVMQQNAEDGGNRKYILVQLPEPTSDDSEARKAGYHTIADITRERLRRAGQRIAQERSGQMDFAGQNIDTGFRAFRLDRSNFKVWNRIFEGTPEERTEQVVKQLKLHVDHVLPEATPESMLYELLLRYSFPLSSAVQVLEMAGHTVFAVESDPDKDFYGILMCLDATITQELIDALVEKAATFTILLDKAFQNDDQLKTNTVFNFRSQAERLDRDVEFWTV